MRKGEIHSVQYIPIQLTNAMTQQGWKNVRPTYQPSCPPNA